MLEFLNLLWLTLGILVVGTALLAFLLHSAGIVWVMTKGRKK